VRARHAPTRNISLPYCRLAAKSEPSFFQRRLQPLWRRCLSMSADRVLEPDPNEVALRTEQNRRAKFAVVYGRRRL
jgi:hypothetical protein